MGGGRVYCLVQVGKYVWAAGDGGRVTVIDSVTKEAIQRFSAHVEYIRAMLYVDHPSAAFVSRVWTASPLEGQIRCWNPDTPLNQHEEISMGEGVQVLHQHGIYVWVGANHGELFVLHARTHELRHHFEAHDNDINCLSSHQEHIISGSSDGTMKLWNAHDASLIRVLNTHSNKVVSLHSTHNLLFSGSWAASILVYDAQTHVPLQELTSVHKDSVRCLVSQSIASSLFLWSASIDYTIALFKIQIN